MGLDFWYKNINMHKYIFFKKPLKCIYKLLLIFEPQVGEEYLHLYLVFGNV